jgi:hypothetical protein
MAPKASPYQSGRCERIRVVEIDNATNLLLITLSRYFPKGKILEADRDDSAGRAPREAVMQAAAGTAGKLRCGLAFLGQDSGCVDKKRESS